MTQPNMAHMAPTAAPRTFRKKVTITSTQLLALNATPQELVPAPGAGFALIFKGALIQKPAGTAYVEDATDDLSVSYTDASGLEVGRVDSTGFLDQTTNQIRFVNPYHAASGLSGITPVVNAALVLHLKNGEIITGDSDLNIEVLYDVVDTTPAV